MKIPFQKMHGAGNDFVLMKQADIPKELKLSDLAYAVCHRRFGVGADGLMVADDSRHADYRMHYFNSDGSQGEMCGNGIRCFARFVTGHAPRKETALTVETQAGVKTLQIASRSDIESLVRVNMGKAEIQALEQTMAVLHETIRYSFVIMGVPHVVIFSDRNAPDLVDRLGPEIERHPLFPNRTNVNFCYLEKRNRMQVFTWERGAGHTLACGTGVTSAFAVARELGMMDREASIQVEGGCLSMKSNPDGTLEMAGPARDICTGGFYYTGNKI